MSTAVKLYERDIEQACCGFLELDGWICRKMEANFSEKKRKSVGEVGMADTLAIRYLVGPRGDPAYQKQQAEVMWIEWKRQRGGPDSRKGLFTKAEKAKIHQRGWHARERSRGALTLIAGEDFPATIEGFRSWYMSSGLNRRMR